MTYVSLHATNGRDPAPSGPHGSGPAVRPDRNNAIDGLRFVGFLAVVLLHVVTHTAASIDLRALIDHLMRFAVPVFFLISGYFAQVGKRPPWERWLRTARRLAIIFLFWQALYILADTVLFHTRQPPLLSAAFLLDTLLAGGVAWHLWFLPSLALCLGLFLGLKTWFGWPAVLSVSLALYLAGLVLGPYADALGIDGFLREFGIDDPMQFARSGPFFGTVFVAAGAAIAARPAADRPLLWAGMAFAGLALQIAEALVLMKYSGGVFAPYDFLLGTLPFAVGVFLCLRDRPFPPIAAALGRHALGMYCCHILVLSLTDVALARFSWSGIAFLHWPLTFVLVTLGSVAATMAMARIRFLRPVVS